MVFDGNFEQQTEKLFISNLPIIYHKLLLYLVIMVALWNRQVIIFFALWFLSFFLSFFFFLLSSPNLGSRRLDVYHTSTHGVAIVRI